MKRKRLIVPVLLLCFILSGCTSGESIAAAVIGTETTLVDQQKLKPKKTKDAKLGFQLDAPAPGEEIAVITMESGDLIKVRFFPNEAPKAVYNFKYHALNGYYDGLTFHRIIENFMIQGGDPSGTGTGGTSVWTEPFADEFSENLVNIDGSLAMANSGPNTNSSQFFINYTAGTEIDWSRMRSNASTYKDMGETQFVENFGYYPTNMDIVTDELKDLYDTHGGNIHLDGYYNIAKRGHTVFGQVYEGLSVVEQISTESISSTIQTVEILLYEG